MIEVNEGGFIKGYSPIFTRSDILKLEKLLLENGISLEELIDRASTAVCDAVRRIARPQKRILGLVGSGNNGKDCLLALRKLKNLGYLTGAVFLDKNIFGEAQTDFLDSLIYSSDPDLQEKISLFRPDIVIEGFFGIGFRLPLPENAVKVLRVINELPAVRVAIDLPAGVEADTGRADSNSLQAEITVTFFALKPSHVVLLARFYCGDVVLKTLGFEKEIDKLVKPDLFKIIPDERGSSPLRRSPLAHKKSAKVVVVAGSKNMAGAAFLASKASFYSGAGYVALISETDALKTLKNLLPEAVFADIEFPRLSEAVEKALCLAVDAHSILIGPGISRKSENIRFLKAFIEEVAHLKKPVVIDGDGLYALSEMEKLPDLSKGVLTPHTGEAQRLLKENFSGNLIEDTRLISEKTGAVAVLKGATTAVASGGKVFLTDYANSNLATAGTGDVLSGIIAGLLSLGSGTEEAALQAVSLQAIVSRKLLEKFKGAPILSSELLDYIRISFKGMCGEYYES